MLSKLNSKGTYFIRMRYTFKTSRHAERYYLYNLNRSMLIIRVYFEYRQLLFLYELRVDIRVVHHSLTDRLFT